jgi:exodeoxyribonuclease V beta subunit
MSPQPFDLTEPLPEGVLAIEASAGTGKTYALAGLATRLIAEGRVSASELLVVTFTRAATAELRTRVRRQLVRTAEHVRSPEPPSDDPLSAHLVASSRDRAALLERIDRAVTEFDTATVTTIHGFATQVLGTLGITAGTDPDATLVDDTATVVDEVCADVLAAAAVEGHPADHLPNLGTLTEHTRRVLSIPDLDVVPGPDDTASPPEHRVLAELVRRAVAAVGRRRRHAGTLSFDGVLMELRRALHGSDGLAVARALRDRFRVALIDEFQDTDPVQWDIFSTVFDTPDAGTTLVLVGDPKQAIYAFRGANVWTYADATAPRPGLERRSLTTNWRSDGAMIRALNLFFDGATFGDPGIAYVPLSPAAGHDGLRLTDPAGRPLPSLSIRLALGEDLERTNNPAAPPVQTAAALRAVFADLAGHVRDLLGTAHLPAADGEPPRPLRPSDVAVLVRTGDEADQAQAALLACGVPAVLARGGSVLGSDAATQWRWLLDALLRPSDPARARTFALSWFGGLDAADLAGLDDDGLARLQERLRDLADTLAEEGLHRFLARLWDVTGVSSRVLAGDRGDRNLTDLQHLAELFVAAHPDARASAAGLLAVLDGSADTAGDTETDTDLLARRVESDRQAVQVMTIWVAKGLEFPVVCAPTLWRERRGPTVFHDPATGRRVLDVSKGAPWPDRAAGRWRKERAESEAAGENLRLAYVALTRARHHTAMWWSRTRDSARTAAARLLFARTGAAIDPEAFTAATVPLPPDEDAADVLDPLVQLGQGTIEVLVHGMPPPAPDERVRPGGAGTGAVLEVARLDRDLDRRTQRWSFTAITGRAPALAAGPAWSEDAEPEPAEAGGADERTPDPAEDPELDDRPDGPVPLTLEDARSVPLAALPAGAEFGTMVHAVLEAVDFAAGDLDAELAARIDRERSWRFVDLRPDGVTGATGADGAALLRAGLRAALDTPLGDGPVLAPLRDTTRRDRIDEMPFELRLATRGEPATDRSVGRLVAEHLPADDPLRDWAANLADGVFRVDLAGHLTGSIDLVLRRPGPDGEPRYVVVDYKTNRLHPRGRLPGSGDYGWDALAAAMAEHHYPLQALLYSVALHRYLRWRLPGYCPQAHLGGAAYLFVRGMVGPATPVRDGRPDGVFHWAIPPALVAQLSDLLDGRTDGGRR